jgi:hypothetical protein
MGEDLTRCAANHGPLDRTESSGTYDNHIRVNVGGEAKDLLGRITDKKLCCCAKAIALGMGDRLAKGRVFLEPGDTLRWDFVTVHLRCEVKDRDHVYEDELGVFIQRKLDPGLNCGLREL